MALEIKAFDTSVLTGVKPAGALIVEGREIARNRPPEGVLMCLAIQSDERHAGAFRSELGGRPLRPTVWRCTRGLAHRKKAEIETKAVLG